MLQGVYGVEPTLRTYDHGMHIYHEYRFLEGGYRDFL